MNRRKQPSPTFDFYYAALFQDRWPPLKAALEAPAQSIPFAINLRKPYFLNVASYLAARVLGEIGNQKALDLCAAPGGKTLILSSTLGPEGSLTSNEWSSQRRNRLKRVLEEHLPPEKLKQVRVTGYDATRWGLHKPNSYDLVLLDVPCSSERHLMEKPAHLERWTPNRTRRLSQQAYAMLLSALMTARVGGKVLYCTCALSPLENDGVVERVLIRKTNEVKLVSIQLPKDAESVQGEPTRYGIQILPDTSQGAGPLYLSLLEKISSSKKDQTAE